MLRVETFDIRLAWLRDIDVLVAIDAAASALDALGEHRDATILVGAQAIYLHTGDADLGVAEYTTDAALLLAPDLLAEIPPLELALEGVGFFGSSSAIGIWETQLESYDVLSRRHCSC